MQTVKNSIRYVDHAQAGQLKLRSARLQNRAGTFVRPEATSFQAAAASADWSRASDFFVVLTNPAGKDAYPIAATVFALMSRSGSKSRTRVAIEFLRWSLEHGLGTASRLGYVPLPATLVEQVARYWATTFGTGPSAPGYRPQRRGARTGCPASRSRRSWPPSTTATPPTSTWWMPSGASVGSAQVARSRTRAGIEDRQVGVGADAHPPLVGAARGRGAPAAGPA